MTADPNASLHYVTQIGRPDIYAVAHARAMHGRTCSFTHHGVACTTPARYMYVDDCHPDTPYEPACRQHLEFRSAQLDPHIDHTLLAYPIDPTDGDPNDNYDDVPIPWNAADVTP